MKNRIVTALAAGGALLAASAALAPLAHAGNVAWGVSVGGPGFAVTAGQPGWYGGRVGFGPAWRPFAPVVYRPWLRPAPVGAPWVFAPPAVTPWIAPRRVVVVRQPVRIVAPRVVRW